MKLFVGFLVAALSSVASGGNVLVRMPYSSPAGVTYVDGSYHAGLSALPAAYASPLAAAPIATTSYAAVPTVQHVPGVADVPVTRYEAQPGVIQNVVDVAKPAVQTRRFEIRRPAIQKQFYDIEERVVVRPAGSAVVELDEPVSKTQKGPAVIQPAAVAVPAYDLSVAAIQGGQILGSHVISSTPAPAPVFEQEQQQPFSDEDTVSVDNPDFSLRSGLPRASGPSTPATYPEYEGSRQQLSLPQIPTRDAYQARNQLEQRLFTPQQGISTDQTHESAQVRSFDAGHAIAASRTYDSLARTAPNTFTNPPQTPPQSYRTSQAFGSSPAAASYQGGQQLLPQVRAGDSTIASARTFQPPEVSHANQQRLIELLTARGGVAEVGYARSGAAISSAGESGQVRGRVISATPAPEYSEPTDERVNTRRIVVSRPIETLQEVEVAEPVTKYERIQVNQPTLIKTARQDLLRVPTSVPVYGKALTPVAHAAALPLAAPAHNPWQ